MRKTQQGRKEASHERILEAAARAIRRTGYDGAGVADIMKEAGLTHGLERLDLLRQRGLLNAQRCRCAGHLAGLRNGDEVAEVTKVHMQNIWKVADQYI